MSAALKQMLKFGSYKTLTNHLGNHNYTRHLDKSVIEKTAMVFATRKYTRQELRDNVTKIVCDHKFSNITENSHAWTDLVFALEDRIKKK